MTVLLVTNPTKDSGYAVTGQAAALLHELGVAVVMAQPVFESKVPIRFLPEEEAYREADFVITIGGDGTLLKAGLDCVHYGKPVLGVNLGRTGFLATCEINEMEAKLAAVARGDFSLDSRMLLYVRVIGDNQWMGHALNDVVVTKGRLQQAIDFSIYCDDILVQHYRGDGVIVATPTGSTAYSLAAGGPILDSKTKGFVVTPICPHSLANSAMVFAQERKINICVGQVADDEVFLSCDGVSGYPLRAGATAEVRLSNETVQLITFGNADQFEAIDQKLRSRR